MENSDTYFNVSKNIGPVNTIIQKLVDKYLMGIFISRQEGDILYFKQFSNKSKIKISLMSNFLSALQIFGEENLGKIKRILIEGLDIEMSVVVKHGLICTILFRPNMVKDYLKEECEKGLDLFYQQFKNQIENHRANQSIYDEFDDTMALLIHKYLIRIDVI